MTRDESLVASGFEHAVCSRNQPKLVGLVSVTVLCKCRAPGASSGPGRSGSPVVRLAPEDAFSCYAGSVLCSSQVGSGIT